MGARTANIETARPCENGYGKSFNGKLRDEPLNCDVFDTLKEAHALIEEWRWHCDGVRPQARLGYRPPAPETRPSAISCISSGADAAAMAHEFLRLDHSIGIGRQ